MLKINDIANPLQIKRASVIETLFNRCGEDGIRTHDLLTASQAL